MMDPYQTEIPLLRRKLSALIFSLTFYSNYPFHTTEITGNFEQLIRHTGDIKKTQHSLFHPDTTCTISEVNLYELTEIGSTTILFFNMRLTSKAM